MKKIPRRVWIPTAGLVLVAAVFALARGRPVQVGTAAAVRDTLSVTIAAEGRTRARDLYTVAAPVTGRLARLAVKEGDNVSEGDTVGRIFPAEQDPRTLATLRAEVEAARAGELEARTRVSEAELQARQTQREVDRRRPLADMGAISAETMEQVELAATVANQRLDAAEAALDAARAASSGAQARLLGARSGQSPGPAMAITAPVSGRVLHIPDESERVVAAGEPLLELANTGGLEVVLDLLSEDAVRVEAGQELRITSWGGDGILEASVRTVTLAGYTKVSALGVEEQRVDVFADLRHAPPSLGTGYRVSGQIVVWRGEDVLSVPTSALFRAGDAWHLYLAEGGRAHDRVVTVGQRNQERAEILEGVEEGQRVILFPSEQVEDGARVRSTSGPDGSG